MIFSRLLAPETIQCSNNVSRDSAYNGVTDALTLSPSPILDPNWVKLRIRATRDGDAFTYIDPPTTWTKIPIQTVGIE